MNLRSALSISLPLLVVSLLVGCAANDDAESLDEENLDEQVSTSQSALTVYKSMTFKQSVASCTGNTPPSATSVCRNAGADGGRIVSSGCASQRGGQSVFSVTYSCYWRT